VKEDPTPLDIAPTYFPPSLPEGGLFSPPVPRTPGVEELDLGGRSVIGDQSKGKEGKIFVYYVLDTVKLINGLVPDPKRHPDIMNKHFTEQMADFVACP
jgi:hypothetical protein